MSYRSQMQKSFFYNSLLRLITAITEQDQESSSCDEWGQKVKKKIEVAIHLD
jgi:hypothetical protein